MAFDFLPPSLIELKPRISVIGVGGAGGNAVANMISAGLEGVDFIVANTDAQSLAASPAGNRIQLGPKITQGLGAGARPEIGAAAAEEAMDALDAAIEGSHMLFITAGMGGGTGTGAAPVVARAAREKGILTVGVVTKPFSFEGQKRMRAAEAGIAELQRHVDTLIVIPNQNLFLIANAQTSIKAAFAMADDVLSQGVSSITDLMILPGLINLDFADVRTVMSEMGKAMMGTGEAQGERRAIEAAEKAISNPLLDEVSLRGAKAVIINITGGDDLGLMEVEEAAQHIREMVDADANIIVGSGFNAALEGRMRVSVVATGIDNQMTLPGVAQAGLATPGVTAAARAPATNSAISHGIMPPPPGATPPGGHFTPPPTPPMGPNGGPGGGLPIPAPMFADAGTPFPGMPATPAPRPMPDLAPAASAAPEDDILDLDDQLDEPVMEAPARAPVVVELPLTEPVAAAPAEPVHVEEPRPLTLFERMMNMHRKPRAEPEPVATLAPEQETTREDATAIPPFFRAQRNG
ncbi:cell division protein FtsZ [Sandaracinobacteroides saxicola]|uniref:Cell division protein FtsZ n=1 Tax=Sandaracinobacteroides saxicola TaxID=2759707 RepID=A0A7G5IG78_9SPHN|nr:cell division protein FtsZ [Sandaracinobacteroides saxicola]QMW22370.1 cell division protein FtsZ [Sandaracinobacteroides saxicola]